MQIVSRPVISCLQRKENYHGIILFICSRDLERDRTIDSSCFTSENDMKFSLMTR